MKTNSLTMQDTVSFLKKLLTEPHNAYAEALKLFSHEQRWAYFKMAMGVTIICSLVSSLVISVIISASDGVANGVVFTLFVLTAVFFIYLYNIIILPALLFKVGGWFKGVATYEKLRELSFFGYFVLWILGAMTLISVLLPSAFAIVVTFMAQILYLVFFVKGLQHIQKYDLLDALFTFILSYVLVVVVSVFIIVFAGLSLVTINGFKFPLLGF